MCEGHHALARLSHYYYCTVVHGIRTFNYSLLYTGKEYQLTTRNKTIHQLNNGLVLGRASIEGRASMQY